MEHEPRSQVPLPRLLDAESGLPLCRAYVTPPSPPPCEGLNGSVSCLKE